MQCPKCYYEPRNQLLSSPCPNPNCLYIWYDTQDYVKMLADDLEITSVLDVGCGTKGIIAQNYWENDRKIKQGYACDKFILKEGPKLWTPLLMDIEKVNIKVDFITHCGLMEHIDYETAFRVFEKIEKIAIKRVFFTFSAMLRDVDYKVKLDGNPYHYYKSFWDARTIECLGYYVDRKRMAKEETFVEEVTGWFDPKNIKTPFETRKKQAIESLVKRECKYCNREPVVWDATIETADEYLCLTHYQEKLTQNNKTHEYLNLWFLRDDVEEVFSAPPWRERKKVL